jgi:hypothetical protein
MEIEEIDARQWTSGDHGPDGTLPDWDVIYDKEAETLLAYAEKNWKDIEGSFK